jgi:hypothetical protein
MLRETEYMFGQLFATIDNARMTKQNWPNFPRGGKSTAASRPPMPDVAYPSAYAGVLIEAVMTAAPMNCVNSNGNKRPQKVEMKTLGREIVLGW